MKNTYVRVLSTVLMGFFALICVYPLIWLVLNSFKPTIDIVSGKSFGLPETIMLENYRVAIFDKDIFRFFGNSMIVTVATIFLTVVLSCMLAYACTRMIWKYRNYVLALITLGILLPSQIVIAPVFILICSLGLVNTRIALVLTVSAFNLAISTLIASSFLKNIPSEVEEAAVIDGAGIFRIFSAIILPILKPAISAMSISIFLSSWNEFIYALVLINSESMKTLPIMLMSFSELRTGINYGGMFAAMVLASIVPIIMYLSFSSQVENALTAGAILK